MGRKKRSTSEIVTGQVDISDALLIAVEDNEMLLERGITEAHLSASCILSRDPDDCGLTISEPPNWKLEVTFDNGEQETLYDGEVEDFLEPFELSTESFSDEITSDAYDNGEIYLNQEDDESDY